MDNCYECYSEIDELHTVKGLLGGKFSLCSNKCVDHFQYRQGRIIKHTPAEVQKYLESLGYYKDVVFVEEEVGDCMYFVAFRNSDGIDVSIRADVEETCSPGNWNIYECDDQYDWGNIVLIYQNSDRM